MRKEGKKEGKRGDKESNSEGRRAQMEYFKLGKM